MYIDLFFVYFSIFIPSIIFFTLNSMVFSKVYILDKGLLIFKHLNSLLLNKVGMKAKHFGTLIDFSSSMHSLRYSKRLIVVPVSWLFL